MPYTYAHTYTKLTLLGTARRRAASHTRLLAHAGFDARHAVRFWEGRQECERTAECSPKRAVEVAQTEEWVRESSPMRWMGATHPMNVIRTKQLKQELERWEKKREETIRAMPAMVPAMVPVSIPAPVPAPQQEQQAQEA